VKIPMPAKKAKPHISAADCMEVASRYSRAAEALLPDLVSTIRGAAGMREV
jgi:hypothetical protein